MDTIRCLQKWYENKLSMKDVSKELKINESIMWRQPIAEQPVEEVVKSIIHSLCHKERTWTFDATKICNTRRQRYIIHTIGIKKA